MPQIATMEARVARYNAMYARIVSQLEDVPEFEIPPYNARVRPVQDSLQVSEA